MRKMYKMTATALALGLAVASPMATMTTHALGFVGDFDGGYEETGTGEFDWDGNSGGSSSSSSSSSSSNNSSESSYEAPSYSDNGSSSDNGGSSNNGGSSDNGGSAVSAPAKNPNDITVGTTGGQKFRVVMSGDHTSYQIFHCGISKVTFSLADKDGNAVAYKTIAIEQGEDKLWYANITFAEGVDTTGYVVGVSKGDATYLSTELGVSGIKINGTVVLSTVPPTVAEEPAYTEIYDCNCGWNTTDYNELKTHMFNHALNSEAYSYTTVVKKQ